MFVKLIQTDNDVTTKSCKIDRLLFAEGLVLLASAGFGLQEALIGFATASVIAGVKTNTFKNEALYL